VIVTASGRRDGSGVGETAPLSPATPGPLPQHPSGVHRLSEREREILQLLADGYTGTGITETLGMSPATLRTHRQNILRKAGVHSMLRAVVLALEAGVIR
jgi:DNA-binding NarL/FixJ family response regulator